MLPDSGHAVDNPIVLWPQLQSVAYYKKKEIKLFNCITRALFHKLQQLGFTAL